MPIIGNIEKIASMAVHQTMVSSVVFLRETEGVPDVVVNPSMFVILNQDGRAGEIKII